MATMLVKEYQAGGWREFFGCDGLDADGEPCPFPATILEDGGTYHCPEHTL